MLLGMLLGLSKETFWLLRPGNDPAGIRLPTAWSSDPLAYGPIQVRRDDGNENNRSDWFTDVDLDLEKRNSSISSCR